MESIPKESSQKRGKTENVEFGPEDRMNFYGPEEKARFIDFKGKSIAFGRTVILKCMQNSHCDVMPVFETQKLVSLFATVGDTIYEEPVRMFYANLCLNDKDDLESMVLGTRIILDSYQFEKIFATKFVGSAVTDAAKHCRYQGITNLYAGAGGHDHGNNQETGADVAKLRITLQATRRQGIRAMLDVTEKLTKITKDIDASYDSFCTKVINTLNLFFLLFFIDVKGGEETERVQGQALDGHQRSHLLSSSTTASSSSTVSDSLMDSSSVKFPNGFIDLNLPAPTEDEDFSRVKFVGSGLVSQEPCMDIEWSEPKLLGLSSTCVKKVLTSSVRWSSASKWEEERSKSHTERVSPLLVAEGQLEGDSYRWQSHNSDSPVWQRPVLMGEKCQTKSVTPLSVVGGQLEGNSCQWHSHNSDLHVWQRSILMGDKCQMDKVFPLPVAGGQLEGESGRWQSHRSTSPVWQRPILMGEKCITEKVSPLLVAGGQLEGGSARWQSHNSNSAVWQRPILMGEKCMTDKVSPLFLSGGQLEGESGRWQSHGSISPVWQRPILMGEKCQTEKVSPLLVTGGQLEGDSARWHSHNSISPVWQRPILMGEKCELPRFSGLILYDERGRPVHHVDNDQFSSYQVKHRNC
ncbi:hypothetical protein A4A49_37947 [Nicotiana attenuata]|uniref:Uncharacterized protein n=1 Tax=Nicotiana attenuata TaxID=49451 RepID=A0A1J6I1S4_NICAT|nr:hypothetical protein A4A49_37947 [Nicotiana attenuata]